MLEINNKKASYKLVRFLFVAILYINGGHNIHHQDVYDHRHDHGYIGSLN